jgi:CRISPR-associated protein Csx14
MANLEPTHTLLATLGGQPQVVTFTLDLLLERGIPIREVIVVHPASYDSLQNSIACLNAEFPGDRYRPTGQAIRFRRHVLKLYNTPIDDIVDERSAQGALIAMNDLIRSLKQQERSIHFSITGGRRLMSYLSFSAAFLNFEHTDRLWHIHTPEDVKKRVRNGACMHASPGDNIRLIEVPFTHLSQPILAHVLKSGAGDTKKVIDIQEERAKMEHLQRCRAVLDRITPTQNRVLQRFARGLSPQEVAHELGISIKTVSSHTTVLLRECRNAWDLPDKKTLDYHFLHKYFVVLFQAPTDKEESTLHEEGASYSKIQ